MAAFLASSASVAAALAPPVTPQFTAPSAAEVAGRARVGQDAQRCTRRGGCRPRCPAGARCWGGLAAAGALAAGCANARRAPAPRRRRPRRPPPPRAPAAPAAGARAGRRPPARRADHGRRAPRRLGLPARAHARGLRARDPDGRRRRRRRPRPHPRRRARRAPRARDRRDHRRRRRAPSSPRAAPPRRSTGPPTTGWFTTDFTLAELRTLRAKERIPADAPAQHALRRPVPGGDLRRGPRPARPPRRRAAPPRRRAARGQALDLLREPRPARGARAGRHPAPAGPRPRGLRGDHPVVRDRRTCGRSRARSRARCCSSSTPPARRPADLVAAGRPAHARTTLRHPGRACARSPATRPGSARARS